jgi:hypothetical protein
MRRSAIILMPRGHFSATGHRHDEVYRPINSRRPFEDGIFSTTMQPDPMRDLIFGLRQAA